MLQVGALAANARDPATSYPVGIALAVATVGASYAWPVLWGYAAGAWGCCCWPCGGSDGGPLTEEASSPQKPIIALKSPLPPPPLLSPQARGVGLRLLPRDRSGHLAGLRSRPPRRSCCQRHLAEHLSHGMQRAPAAGGGGDSPPAAREPQGAPLLPPLPSQAAAEQSTLPLPKWLAWTWGVEESPVIAIAVLTALALPLTYLHVDALIGWVAAGLRC